jgi:hypothetical protein
MDFLTLILFVAGGGLLSYVVGDLAPEWLAKLRARRLGQGKPVSFPARVSVDGGKLRRARILRTGDRLLVRTWRGRFEMPANCDRVAARIVDDSESMREWRLERHADADGRAVDVGVRVEDGAALAAVRRGAPTTHRPFVRPWAVTVAGVFLLGLVVLTALYGVSYDATATVRDVNDDASSCLVEWSQSGRSRLTHVDCGSYDAASVGMTLPIVAQPAPFDGQAFSGERREIFEIDATILVAVGLILGFGVWRARWPSHGVPLTPVLLSPGPGTGSAEVSTGHPREGEESTVVALAARLVEVEAWRARHTPTGLRDRFRQSDVFRAVIGAVGG